MKEVLLIGKRRAAIEAARKLGCSVSVQRFAPRPEQADGAFGGNIADSVAAARERYLCAPPDAVLAVAEGAVPSAAAIRAAFGLAGLDLETALRCHDKLLMKKAIAAAGIPCAPWLETTAGTTPEDIIDSLGLPAVLKLPVSSGGRGVTICNTREELARALRPGLLAEAFMKGVEMSVETFSHGGTTLFRNHTRYLVPQWASIVPATVSHGDCDGINSLADRAHAALGVGDGVTHLEIFLTADGPIFGEIAARPPGGRIMELIGLAYEFDPWEANLRIAMGEAPALPGRATGFAGAWLLYPEPGVVKEVTGLDRAKEIPCVVRIACRARRGDHYPERLGTGQSAGEIIVVAPTSAKCEQRLREARAAIDFEAEK